MKAVSAPLLALMQSSQQFMLADLYTFTLNGGTVLRYTDFDADIVSGGNTYSSSGPALKRTKTRLVIGLEVDTLDVSIYPHPTDLLSGVSMAKAVTAGAFDGARLRLDRAYLTPLPLTLVGTIQMFSGLIADTGIGRTEISLRVNSDISALAIKMPRNLFQPACMHTLYDADCTVTRASQVAAATVASGTTASTINCGLSQQAGWFERGYIQFTSGALNGTKRTVKGSAPGVVSLFLPLPSVPANGDTFNAYPGCDRTQSTCTNKFSNVIHFRATPLVPVPETVL